MSETDTLGKFKKNARIYRQWFASRVANQPKNKIVEIYRLRQNVEVKIANYFIWRRCTARVCIGLEPDFVP